MSLWHRASEARMLLLLMKMIMMGLLLKFARNRSLRMSAYPKRRIS